MSKICTACTDFLTLPSNALDPGSFPFEPFGFRQACRGSPGNAVLQTIPTGHHIAIQLQLRELEQREVILADGHRRTVLGNEVLLWAIPMQDMALVLRPR